MKKILLVLGLSFLCFAVAGLTSKTAASEEKRIRYSIQVDGYAISEAADGQQSYRGWDEIDSSKFVHIHASGLLPDSVTTLQAKYRKLSGAGEGDPKDDVNVTARRGPTGSFDFVIDHYALQPDSTYLVRVSNDFASKDIKCVATNTFKTIKDTSK